MMQYQSPPWEVSILKGVPIGLYNPQALRDQFGPIRVKFRGPRPANGRSRIARQGTCLKQDAITFAVYRR